MKISWRKCAFCDTPWPHPALTAEGECPTCYAKRTLVTGVNHSKD